jgi:hypothetical protein
MSLETSHEPIHDEFEDELVPVAVSVAERALALQAIAAYFNKANMTAGSKTQTAEGSDFQRRYKKDAPVVQKGAEKKTRKRIIGFREAIRILSASEAREANGEDEDDVRLWEVTVQRDVNQALGGVGRRAVARRARAVNEASQYVDPNQKHL